MKLKPALRLFVAAGVSCLFLLVACGGGSGAAGAGANVGGPAAQPPSPPGPTPPPPKFRVSGEVFSFDTGVIGDAEVDISIRKDYFSYSYWWVWGLLQSDELGQFDAELPASEISVLAFKDGFVQPCGIRHDVTEDVHLFVEMLPVSALNTLNPLPPQSSSEPSVTGTIFENTANGRQVITGASLWAEDEMGILFATTRSDLAGGFYMCNLPKESFIAVTKTGFKTRSVALTDATRSVVMDIELERETQ